MSTYVEQGGPRVANSRRFLLLSSLCEAICPPHLPREEINLGFLRRSPSLSLSLRVAAAAALIANANPLALRPPPLLPELVNAADPGAGINRLSEATTSSRLSADRADNTGEGTPFLGVFPNGGGGGRRAAKSGSVGAENGTDYCYARSPPPPPPLTEGRT